MLADDHPDRIQIAFDDHRLVANAGLLLPATLGRHLGLPELVDRHLDLGRAPGRANTGDKVMTLVASELAGGDCIDDADVLRAGGTARVLGCVVKAPSTLGTFLFRFRKTRYQVGFPPRMTLRRLMRLIAITARICTLYRDFSAISDGCFRPQSPVPCIPPQRRWFDRLCCHSLFGSPVDVGDAGLAHQIEAISLLRFEHHHEGSAGIIAKASRSC